MRSPAVAVVSVRRGCRTGAVVAAAGNERVTVVPRPGGEASIALKTRLVSASRREDGQIWGGLDDRRLLGHLVAELGQQGIALTLGVQALGHVGDGDQDGVSTVEVVVVRGDLDVPDVAVLIDVPPEHRWPVRRTPWPDGVVDDRQQRRNVLWWEEPGDVHPDDFLARVPVRGHHRIVDVQDDQRFGVVDQHRQRVVGEEVMDQEPAMHPSLPDK